MGLVRKMRNWWLALALAGILLNLMGSAAAWAQDQIPTKVTLRAIADSPVLLGNTVKLEASLQDIAGTAIGGATLRFHRFAYFLGGEGQMEIGEATTDSNGAALFEYLPREQGDIQVTAVYEGNSQYASSQSSTTFAIEGYAHFYKAAAGIRVLFLGKWLLVAVLGGIWGTYLLVVTLVLRIALSSRSEERGGV